MENSARTAAYGSFKTTNGYLESLRKARVLPQRIDNSTMGNLNGRNKIEVKAALIFLGLIKEDGTPTAALRSLIDLDGEELKNLWQNILTEAYPTLLGESTDGFDLRTASSGQLREKFRKMGLGQETMLKAERFFLHAAELAGIPISKFISDQRKAGRPSGASRPKTTNSRPKSTGADSELKSSQSSSQVKKTDKASQPTTFEERMLQETGQLPPFDPEWDIEEKKLWYEQQRFLVSQWRGVQAPDLRDDETEDEL